MTRVDSGKINHTPSVSICQAFQADLTQALFVFAFCFVVAKKVMHNIFLFSVP